MSRSNRYALTAVLSLVALLNLASAARADVLVGSNRTESVLRFDECSGTFLGEFIPGGSGGLMRPGGLAIGADRNLYVSSNGTDAVLRYDGRTGEFINVFAAGGGLTKPSGLAFGPDRNLYVNSQGTNAVLRYDGTTGEFIDVFAMSDDIDQNSVGLTFGPDGNLYINSHRSNSVMRFDGTTGKFLDIFASGPELEQPSGLAFGPDGNLYVASHGPNPVVRYDGGLGRPHRCLRCCWGGRNSESDRPDLRSRRQSLRRQSREQPCPALRRRRRDVLGHLRPSGHRRLERPQFHTVSTCVYTPEMNVEYVHAIWSCFPRQAEHERALDEAAVVESVDVVGRLRHTALFHSIAASSRAGDGEFGDATPDGSVCIAVLPPAFRLLVPAGIAATFSEEASMRMSRLIGQLIISVSGALLLAACGNSTTSPTPPPAAPPAGSGATVTISSAGVSPSQVTVSVGQTVTFANNDTAPHDVESDPHPAHTDCPAINQVGPLQPGQSRQTGSLTTARTCGFHDHLNPGIAALKGSITIR